MASIHSAFPKPIFLSAGTRSPIGKFGGSLKRFAASELASLTLKECIQRAAQSQGDEKISRPDFVFLGHARQAGARPNPARQAAIFAGLSEEIPAITFNQACASGLSAIIAGAEKLALGRATSVYAGGVESMSNTPYLLMQGRFGLRMGNSEMVDGMVQDGFYCPLAKMLMGETVETYLAKELKITREEQDLYALRSQARAEKAWNLGHFDEETFLISGDAKNPELRRDEHPRAGTTLEMLKKLPPVFDKNSGSVTAGNSSGITDGAAFFRMSLEAGQSELELLDYEMTALDPRKMGLGPVESTQKILRRHSLTMDEIEAVELNEAFAAQVIACNRELKIPDEKLNTRGGAIALGHPIGATGARILVTLAHILKGKKGALGIATLCVSGGQGVSVLVRAQ